MQHYNYDQGFLIETLNYGRPENGVATYVGKTTFDRYGRQEKSFNEIDVDGDGTGELTTKYQYSSEGFLASAYNYGAGGSMQGKTVFNALGKPAEAYNQRNAKVQDFNYNEFSGSMVSSYNYGYDNDKNQYQTGTTYYDAFGKAFKQTNENGYIVGMYEYDTQGFMTRAFNFGAGGTPVENEDMSTAGSGIFRV